MFGVWACGWPFKQPIQSFRSSTIMTRTFGGDVSADHELLAENKNANETNAYWIRVLTTIPNN